MKKEVSLKVTNPLTGARMSGMDQRNLSTSLELIHDPKAGSDKVCFIQQVLSSYCGWTRKLFSLWDLSTGICFMRTEKLENSLASPVPEGLSGQLLTVPVSHGRTAKTALCPLFLCPKMEHKISRSSFLYLFLFHSSRKQAIIRWFCYRTMHDRYDQIMLTFIKEQSHTGGGRGSNPIRQPLSTTVSAKKKIFNLLTK